MIKCDFNDFHLIFKNIQVSGQRCVYFFRVKLLPNMFLYSNSFILPNSYNLKVFLFCSGSRLNGTMLFGEMPRNSTGAIPCVRGITIICVKNYSAFFCRQHDQKI
jgi:hypothetical protein